MASTAVLQPIDRLQDGVYTDGWWRYADQFQLLDTAGLVYVLVKIPNPEKSRGFDPILLGIKPGNQLKVVGFSD
jgi:hypothetical protein